ncbi:hypothetical protein GF312_11760 [Candidatus Poribacteria bacterium]|nr:hypothetical protein [Candidatus Poribacteria bacterium]
MNSEEVDIIEYTRVLIKRSWIILLSCLLAASIAFIVSLSLDKIYETDMSIRIISPTQNKSSILNNLPQSASSALGLSVGDQQMQTYSQILKSRNIITKVIDHVPELMQNYTLEQKRGLISRFQNNNKYPHNLEIRKKLLIKEVTEKIKVRHLGGDIVQIRVRWDKPQLAVKIAQKLGENLIKYDTKLKQEKAAKTRNLISYMLKGKPDSETLSSENIQAELSKSEKALRDFKNKYKAFALPDETSKLMDELMNSRAFLHSTKTELNSAKTQLHNIQKQLQEQEKMVTSSKTISENPINQYLKKEASNLEVKAKSLSKKMGESNPELEDMRDLISEYNKQIDSEPERIIAQETISSNPMYNYLKKEETKLILDIKDLEIKESSIEKRISNLETEMEKIPEQEMQLARLEREVEAYKKIYIDLRQRESEAKLAGESAETNLSILDKPDLPIKPYSPKVLINTAIAGVLGFLLGLFLVFLIEYFKRAKFS